MKQWQSSQVGINVISEFEITLVHFQLPVISFLKIHTILPTFSITLSSCRVNFDIYVTM